MAIMAQISETRSKAKLWSGDLLVGGIFLSLWIVAVIRLCINYAGDTFLAWNLLSMIDSLFVVVAPFVILMRVLHFRNGLKARRV
jgi:hypothetical protein